MFFEGACFASELNTVLRNALVTVNPATGLPFWQMVSSNVGTSMAADGFVFHSRGSRRDSDIFIGISSVLDASSHRGFRLMVAGNYIPSQTAGVNGVLTNPLYEQTPFANTAITVETLRLNYWFSVDVDRVIVFYRPVLTVTDVHTNLLYMGLPAHYFDSRDRGVVLGAAIGFTNNAPSSRMLETANTVIRQMNPRYSLSSSVNRIEQLHPSPIYLETGGSLRGVLDIMWLPQDERIGLVNHIDVGTAQYLGIRLPATVLVDAVARSNNFSFTAAVLLIPKR